MPEVEQSQRIVQAAPRMAALLLRMWERERERGNRPMPEDLSYLLADMGIIPWVHFLGTEEVGAVDECPAGVCDYKDYAAQAELEASYECPEEK